MKKLFYLLIIILSTSTVQAKSWGSGFAWGTLAGFATSEITNKAHRIKPHLYVVNHHVPQPPVYVVQEPNVVYYPQLRQPICTHKEVNLKKEDSSELHLKQIELDILKEQNRKKELALKEKELDIQLFKLKQL